MAEYAQIDDRSFPLVVVTYPVHPTLRTLDDYFDRMRSVVERGRFALVADIRPVSMRDVDAELRRTFFRRVSEWDAGPGKDKKICEAIVIDSWFTRTLVATYMSQVQPKGFELRTMASVEEARTWATRHIVADSLAS